MTGPTSIGAHMSIPGFKPHGITNVHVNHTGPRSSFALAVAGAVLAGAFALTACAPAATPTAADPTTASEPAPPASEAGAAGTQPAGGALAGRDGEGHAAGQRERRRGREGGTRESEAAA